MMEYALREDIIYVALDRCVIAVAVIKSRPEGSVFDWSCYIGAVRGKSHPEEYMKVAKEGSKLPMKLATLIFPTIPKEKYRR